MKVGRKLAPTRAGAKKSAVSVPKRRGGRAPLDVGKAVQALAAGKPTAAVALAAGSKAKSRRALNEIGRRLIDRLRKNGQIQDAFNEGQLTLQRFADAVAEQALGAMKVSRHYDRDGNMTDENLDIDWQARTAARQQYMQAMGLCRLQIEDDTGPGDSPLGELTDEQLCELRRYAAEVAAKDAGGGG